VKGVHSLGSAGCGEKRELEIWNYCETRTWVWGCSVWRVLTTHFNYGVNSMCHEAMYLMVQLSLKTYWFYKAILALTLLFVTEISAPLRGIMM
jgi:hypothetical protein